MSDQVDNLDIWNRRKATPDKYLKKGVSDKQGKISISGQYMIQQATEEFGPMGKGWGVRVLDERFDKGHMIFHPQQAREGNFVELGHIVTHVVKIELWYISEGKECSVISYGDTDYTYWSSKNNTFITDGQAPKKSLTDATKKALSIIGFSADIYLGNYEDHGYRQSEQMKLHVEQADNRADEISRQKDALRTDIENTVEKIKTSKSKRESMLLAKPMLITLDRRSRTAEFMEFCNNAIKSIQSALNSVVEQDK